MFKPGDRMNPYDPASIEQWDNPLEGLAARLESGVHGNTFAKLADDPAKMKFLEEMMKADIADAALRGETMQERQLREKREWAVADARSAVIKTEGNAAFREGLYKDAYVLYSACVKLSGHEPLYRLNRSAAALKLGMYEDAILDATVVIDEKFKVAKARYRRSCAFRFYGDLKRAAKDLNVAAKLEPNDTDIKNELAELSKLQAMSEEELKIWVEAQKKSTVFESDADEKLLELVDERLEKD